MSKDLTKYVTTSQAAEMLGVANDHKPFADCENNQRAEEGALLACVRSLS